MRWTAEHDHLIREVYTPPYRRGAVAELARKIGVQPWNIAHRRSQLGIRHIMDTYYQGKPIGRRKWTTEELRLLEKHRKIFLDHGFDRSAESIQEKRYRMGWRAIQERDEDETGYTAKGIGDLLSVDHTTVLRWIRKGHLKSTPEYNYGRIINHRVTRDELRRFLKTHVTLWEPGKTDKFWLIDLLMNQ
jgi:hypothetical protein